MSDEIYSLEPKDVPEIETQYRRICTPIPVPESLPILERLREVEPISMRGQPPVVWDRAEGVQVYDKWGNMWLDFSSGVLVANAGHGRQPIIDAIIAQAQHGLIHNYCFPSEVRARCCEKILEFVNIPYLEKVYLLTTGSEATECAMKLARTWGHMQGGNAKNVMVSFENGFHGRTLGAQLMGGSSSLKDWIMHRDPDIVQVPFPDGFYNENTSFDLFEETLAQLNIEPDNVCGVIVESYQGGGADFLPVEYAQALREWCTAHNALLIFDEVQAGFGRTGKVFCFQHYDVEADLVCAGKGISSGLPVSAVIGRKEILDIYAPNTMTSTHTGNPICCASVIANLDLIISEGLVENAAVVGEVLQAKLQELATKYSIAGSVHGKGLVAGVQIVEPGTRNPDKHLANDICVRIIEKGLMLFSPVGKATLKIAPPLCITAEAVEEGCGVIGEAISEVLAENLL
ncbi:MAG TPA: aspartate aminotransferase family protein [Candidatus Lokiarchaeia archaeon]|nr:aspartate aminotransferase family protein [Candidatus Lokiarchaeia archaeon]